jgi:cobalt-zinc-cadmium resistance protein CzcA
MPPNISDGYIMLKPEAEWPEPRKSRDELLTAIQKTVGRLPGNTYEFSQPIQLRFNELISGVRSDVAIKIFGDDMDVMNDTASKISAVLEKIPGASEVKIEQTTGLPMLTVNIDREKTARYGLNIGDVQDAISTAIGGREAGTMFEGDRRFDIVVRLPDNLRSDLESLKRLPIALPKVTTGNGGMYVRLIFLLAKWPAWRSLLDRTKSAGKTVSVAWSSVRTFEDEILAPSLARRRPVCPRSRFRPATGQRGEAPSNNWSRPPTVSRS